MSGDLLDALTAAGIAEAAVDLSLDAARRADGSAAASAASAATAAATRDAIAALVGAIGLPVRWLSDTALQIRLPDGSYTDPVDLQGPIGPRGRTPSLAVGTVAEGEFAVIREPTSPDEAPILDFVLPRGLAAWTPVPAFTADGARLVLRIVDWTGGQGAKPATGLYVGATGLVADLAAATDLRGAPGLGNVTGPAASSDGELLLASGTGGTTLKRTNAVPTAFGLARLLDADAAGHRAAIGLVPGTDVQAYDADLAAIAALATAAFGRSLLTKADAASLKALLAIAVGDVAGAAPLDSPALIGAPTAPNAPNGDASTKVATTSFVAAAVAALINMAPAALDTLGEIAAQLANDESAVSALTTTVAGKLAKASNLSDLTNTATARTNLGVAIGVNVQAWDADLDAIAALATTAYGRSLLTTASAATLLAVIGALAAASNALAADLYTGTTTAKFVTPKVLYDASAFVALTDAATVAVDLSTLLNAAVTLAGNRTLGNPTNAKAGQSGIFRVLQDATGSRTLAFGTAYDFGAAGAPTLQTAAGKEDLISYVVVDAATPRLRCVFSKGA